MWVLRVIAITFVVLIALVTLVAFLPIRVTAEYSEEGFESYLKVLFFRMKLPPQRKDKGKKKDEKKTETKKRPGRLKSLVDFIEPIFRTFGKLMRMLCVRKLVLNINVATDDAFLTAMLYGSAAAAVNTLFPFVDRNIKIKKKYISINADFEAKETKVYAFADISLFVLQVVILASYFIYQYMKKQSEKKKGNEKNG